MNKNSNLNEIELFFEGVKEVYKLGGTENALLLVDEYFEAYANEEWGE